MVRIIVAACLVFALSSCKHEDGSDGDHLPREVMQKVLLDVNLAEGYSISLKDTLHKMGQKNIDSLSAFYERIFDHYKITEQQFNSSLDWYKYHPSELDSIYVKLIPIVANWQIRTPPPKVTPLPQPAQPQPIMQPQPAHINPTINIGAPKRPGVAGKAAAGHNSSQN